MQNDSILMQTNYMPVKVALKWLRVGSLTFQRSQLWHPLRFVNESRSFNIQIRGSIVVSISACHADDPGSIPGRGDSYVFNTWATCLLSSQCTNMETLQMAPGDNLRLQWHEGTLLPTTWQLAAKF